MERGRSERGRQREWVGERVKESENGREKARERDREVEGEWEGRRGREGERE